MKNVTSSLDESTLERARRYAAENDMGLNELLRMLLNQALEPPDESMLTRMFERADLNGWRSQHPWSREDAYDPKRVR